MKPFISSGRLRCVGCSTYEEYRTSIETDGALARLFSRVSTYLQLNHVRCSYSFDTQITVCEPSVEETVAILRGMRVNLQAFHKVRVMDDAFVAAASIAAQFFAHKRYLFCHNSVHDGMCLKSIFLHQTP